MTDKQRINIWVGIEQKTKWDDDAQALGITLTDYIKRAVHAFGKAPATAAAVDLSPLMSKIEGLEAKIEKLSTKSPSIGLLETTTIIDCIKAAGPATCATIASVTGLNYMAVVAIIDELVRSKKAHRNTKNQVVIDE